jgi:MFS family permease
VTAEGTGARPTLRELPRSAKWFLIATLVNMIGNGMLFGFLFIYFTDVRHFSSSKTGLFLTIQALISIAFMSVGGWVSDHIGAKRALQIAVVYSACVFGLFSWATTSSIAVSVCVLAGIGQGMMTPAQSAFGSIIVTKEFRPVMSSWLRIVLNIGAGIGIGAAGLFVKVNRPSTFVVLFFANVATFVGYALIVALVHPVASEEPNERFGSYRDVVADRFYMRLLPLDLSIGIMFGMVYMVMPTTFLRRLGGSEKLVGFVALSGTFVVVLSQLAIAKLVHGRARLKALSVMYALFAVGSGMGFFAVGRTVFAAAVLITIAQCVASFGEAIIGPIRGPMTADLAPPQLLGRYFGLQSMMFMGGFGLSNGIAGALLDRSLRGTWIVGAAIAALAGVWALRLDRLVPSHARLSP